MAEPLRVRVTDVDFFMRNVRTRMPFRYGSACVLFAPILHVRLHVESETGTRAFGVAADILPPKWFDKDPNKDFEQNVADLLASAETAANAYLRLSEEQYWTPFELWRQGYSRALAHGDDTGLNHLTAGHGSSLMERAVIDAAGNIEDLGLHELIVLNRLGIHPDQIHSELGDVQLEEVFGLPPVEQMHVRHTVGLADPIVKSDIPPAERLQDGLPQSLEENLHTYGLKYFKVKVSARNEEDLERIRDIAGLLNAEIESEYFVSLDGNEQFKSVGQFLGLMEPIWRDPSLHRFAESIRYIEQPFDRSIALDGKVCATLSHLTQHRPVIIDESDSDLNSFKDAVMLGYTGVSSKNCKGVYKSLLNRMLVEKFNRVGDAEAAPRVIVRRHSQRPPHYFMTGEDLMNTPTVALQQDLTTLSVLGITHAERNGHQYFRGLDHLTGKEREECLAQHAGLYVPFEDSARLDIREGSLDLRSLRVPGLGVGVGVGFDSMTPLKEWKFESLSVTQ